MRLQTWLLAFGFTLLSTAAWALPDGRLPNARDEGDGSSIGWTRPAFGPSFLPDTLADPLSTVTPKTQIAPTPRGTEPFVVLRAARTGYLSPAPAVPEPSASLLFGAGVLITRVCLRRPRSWSSPLAAECPVANR